MRNVMSARFRTGLVAAAAAMFAALGAAQAAHHGGMKDKYAKDIVDTAVGAGQFNTLAAALQAGGLVDTLKGSGPFTVFAPTDAAFAELPDGTLDSLLKPENKDQLVKILSYHVVPGKVTAAQVTGLSEATTVEGQALAISTSGDTVRINDATVVAADVMASNGVIHVIDKVLIPE
jgi:uncharacterized surface protein with fasciclin (FAS1) repeats